MAGPTPPGANDETREHAAIALAIELLKAGRAIQIVVGGTSMWPLVRDGERVRLDPAAAPQVGMLAGVARDGRIVVHRIVHSSDEAIELRGDNLETSDGSLPRSGILGVVTERWTRSGREIDHRTRLRRLAGRAVAFASPRCRWPWRLARAMAVWMR